MNIVSPPVMCPQLVACLWGVMKSHR